MRVLLALAAIVGALALAHPVLAQTPVAWVEVDSTDVSTDDVVTLSVFVEGANQVSQPQLGDHIGFVVLGTSQRFSTTMVNGELSSSFMFRYRLSPVRAGTYSIGPIRVVADGDELLLDSFEIEVQQGGGLVPTPTPDFDFSASGPADAPWGIDHFIRADVDNTNPYIGEQVTYSFRYYAGRPLQDGYIRRAYELPSFEGFWNSGSSGHGRYQETVSGRLYVVEEERTVLFPSLVGTLAIEPAIVRLQEGLGGTPLLLNTEPIALSVRALPPDAPAGFDGAVGKFAIRANVDSTRLSGGDPANLTVTVAGEGNIDALPSPRMPDTQDWRLFSEDPISHSQVVDGELRGIKTFRYVLLPNADGVLEIPPFEYVYFDPSRDIYQTIATDPIRIEIEPGSVDAPRVSQSQVAEDTEGAAIDGDLRELQPITGAVSTRGRGFEISWWHWAALAAPALLILGVEALRRLRAPLEGLKFLQSGRSVSPNASEPPVRQIRSLLVAAAGPPAATWTGRTLAAEMRGLGLQANLVDDVVALVEAEEAREFAPPHALHDSPQENVDIGDILARLEESLR